VGRGHRLDPGFSIVFRSSPSRAPRWRYFDLANARFNRRNYDWTRGIVAPRRSDRAGPTPGSRITGRLRLRVQAQYFCGGWCISAGCRVHGGSRRHNAEDGLVLKPDGVVLSNGPGESEPHRLPRAQQIRKLVGRRQSLRHLPRSPDPGASHFGSQDLHSLSSPPRRSKSSVSDQRSTNELEITSHNSGLRRRRQIR